MIFQMVAEFRTAQDSTIDFSDTSSFLTSSVSSKIEAYNVEPRKWNSTSLAPGLMTEMKYVVDPSLFC